MRKLLILTALLACTSPALAAGEQTKLLIDADSTPSAFADRIRWNQAYYRLAHGL